ncbi:MAG: hypothetical protein RLZZ522_1774, partial [Verrucomicrobiota bacterium]
MKHSRLLPILRLLVALCLCVAGAPQARAQVPAVLKDGFRNVFRTEPTGTPIGVAAPLLDGDLLRPAYLLQRQNGTAFGGFSVNGFGTLSTTIADDTPNVHTATTSAPGTPIPPNYPNNAPTVNQVKGSVFTVQMRSAIIGRPLALFGISYSFGAVIPAPLVNQSNSPTLYRAEPVDSRIKTTVLTNNTTGEKSFPAPVEATTADSDGTTVTTNGDTTTTVTVGPNPKFYWSKHAQKVYATQPGTITVKWRETATTAKDITSTYVIATAPDQEERTIYWTENGFRGPPVEVPVGRVNAVNIVYNTLVPKEVVTPYEPWLAGVTDFTESDPLKKRYKTFFYDNNLIHAYNVAGRVFVEYLGNPRGDGTSEQKGIEIVNVIKETSPVVKVVSLGERVDQLRANETGGTATDLEPKILAGLGLGGQPYLHQQVSAGGTTTSLYAIRETQPGMANTGKALDNEVLVYWMETAALNIKWPKQFVGYVQQWPDAPAAYSTYARPDSARASGLAEALATAVPLDSANNPALVYQDDPANAQALLIPGNKFYTKVTTSDPTNRALLRFTKDEDIWFERVWSQLDPYYKDPTPFLVTKTVTSTAKPAGTFTTGFENILNVQVVNPATGAALVAGVDYTVNAATGVITLVKQTVTSVRITFNPSTLPFSTIPDVLNADIGSRINPPPALKADTFGDTAPVYVGYIHQPSGTSFNVDAYQDPFVAGFDEAAKGAIIPINTIPRNDQLEVWWYKKSTPAGAKISGTYWPSFVQKYALKWPAATRENTITLASNKGSDDLPSLQATGSIYTQNNPALAGYNPNEEHALMLNGRAWALRDDLNETTDEITWTSSKPYVLLDYTEADQRPAMRVFQVTRGTFDYPAIAGKVLQSPMPLPLLPPPLLPDRSLASYEMQGVEDPISASSQFGTSQAPGKDAAFVHYKKFTWTDRKGILWVYRGPHGGNEVTTPTLIMRYFYKTLPGFYYPSLAFNNQPAVGKITPYLRRGTPGAYVGDPVTGVTAVTAPEPRAEQPLDVTFRPQWPDSAPELRVGETLTLPKLGLPQVRGQQSAEFIYQQSVATAPVVPGTENRPDMANRQKSARLFDPTRAKVYPLRPTTLSVIPESVNTSLYLGKTYFPNLPPHLSSRLYFDPAVGQYGSLIFKGVYMNELVGEKYLQLNVMSAADRTAAKALTPVGFDTVSTKIKTDWDAAIDGLVTTMETFVEDPGKLGTFIPLRNEIATPRTPIVIDGKNFTIPPGKEPLVATVAAGTTVPADSRPPTAVNELAEVFYSDTAVDSYAISASGGGKGFVVLAVGNGMDTDFTSKDGPVSLQVFKVNAPLYRGELKVINSQNPLDEKLTLQHTGDFAGHPEEYDFEWRYAPPVDGLPLKLYSYVRKLIVTGKNETWNAIHNPLNNTLDPAQSYQKYRSPKAEMSDVVTSIALLSGGSYTVLPGKVTISDDNVSNATATISGEIKDVTIAQGKGGRNYAQPPAVNFVGGGGSGATGVAIVSDGVITRFDITNKGSGYTSAPTVSLTGGGGSGAEATATLQVGSLTLTNGGIGYTEVPTVTFGGGTLATGGSAASATATFGAPPVVNLPGQITIINGNGTAAHGVTLPHALLRRTFSATQRPLRLFLSLDVGTNDGAVVYLNGAPVAAYHSPGHEDTATTSVPATAPAFDPLPLVFEINANALAASATPDNNVFTVELYTTADARSTTTFNLRLEGSQEVENLTGWLPVGLVAPETASVDSTANDNPPTSGIESVQGKNRHTIQGTSILTLSDNYFIMRYRAKATDNAAYVAGGGWSKWTEPQLAEGWIKRVLAGINPFQQRVKDLFNHQTNTSVSLVEQAGKRWEGNIALNLDNNNDSGLVEIYETV